MKYLPFSPISNVVANATITSAPIDCSQLFKMSVQVVVAGGTATGSMQMQVSNDHSTGAQLFNNQTFTNWSNLGSPVTVTTTGSQLIAQQDVCYKAIRAVYTDGSSGSGSATISVNLFCLAL